MQAIANAGAWPADNQKSQVRFEENGHVIEVTVYWSHIHSMARRALRNKTHTCSAGPVVVREVQ